MFGIKENALPAERFAFPSALDQRSVIANPDLPAGFIFGPAGREIALYQMDKSQIGSSLGGVGPQGAKAMKAIGGFGQLAQSEKDESQITIGGMKLRVQLYSITVSVRRGDEIAFAFEKVSEAGNRLCRVGIDSERAPESLDSRPKVAETCEITDVLGRTTWTSTPVIGEYVSTVYTQNDVLSTLGPAPANENTKSVQNEYDGLGRLTSSCKISSSTPPVGGSVPCAQKTGSSQGVLTTTSYATANGSQTVTSTRSVQNRITTYDGLGRITYGYTPEGGAITYTYDTVSSSCTGNSYPYAGKLESVTFANGNINCYGQYDSLGRITAITGKSGTSYICRRFFYDNSSGATGTLPSGMSPANPDGRMVEAGTDNCTLPITPITDEWFSYDKVGNMTDMWELTPHSGQYYHSTATFYGNHTLDTLQLVSPNLYTMAYGIDGEGRWNTLTESSVSQDFVTGTTYNAASQPTQILLNGTSPNQDQDNYIYDPNTGRMTNWSFTVNSVSETGALQWNPNGTLNNVAITDGFNSGGTQTCYFNPSSGSGMGYDDLGRLLHDSCGSGGSIWNQTYSYEYDNLTKSSSGFVSWNPGYGYNSTNNQYLCTGCTYDASGDVTSDGTNAYTWNQFNRMASVNGTGTNCSTGGDCLVYDALGRLVEVDKGSTHTEIWYTQLGKNAYMNGSTINYAYWPAPGGGTAIINGNSG